MHTLSYSLLSSCISIVTVWNRHSPNARRLIFLVRRLENQVDQHGGVVLRWEHRGSAFMRIIDRQAKEATQMKVCPMRRSFDPDFINILNGNRPFCAEIQRMQQAWRSGYHTVGELNRIQLMEPRLWRIWEPEFEIVD